MLLDNAQDRAPHPTEDYLFPNVSSTRDLKSCPEQGGRLSVKSICVGTSGEWSRLTPVGLRIFAILSCSSAVVLLARCSKALLTRVIGD